VSAAVLLAGLVPAALAAQTIAITGGTVYPVSGPRVEGATVLMRDGRIVSVGRGVAIPAGATVVDATGKWVTPGLIHAQSQLGLGVGLLMVEQENEEYTAIGGTADSDRNQDVSAAFNVQAAIDPDAVAIPVARQGGVTAAVVMPSNGLVAGQAVAIRLAGEGLEGLLLASPIAMVADLSDQTRSAGGGSRAGALARFRTLLLDADLLRRKRADYDANRLAPLSAPAADLEALYPVLDGTLPLYLRVRRQSDIENAIRLATEFHLKLIIRGGTEAWRVAPQLASAGVAVAVDTRDNIPSFDGLRARSDNATLLRQAGVTVLLAGQDPGGQMNLRFEAGHAVRNGMPWADALEAITLAPARAFGLGDRLGSLEPGKSGDLVIWSGDPFEPATSVERVYVAGRERSLDNRMTDLMERYRTLPPSY
jgi:imidazolonepropionase-like amidohydrolase